MSTATVVFPGSFDPITNGHLLIIEKVLKIFDNLTIAIGNNENKDSAFSLEERINMTRKAIQEFGDKIIVESFNGLLSSYMQNKHNKVVVRGIRNEKDLQYELQMIDINNQLNNNINTIFIPTTMNCRYISSSLVKKIASMGGDVSGFVPHDVNIQINRLYHAKRP